MRGTLLVACLLLGLAASGCFGADVHVEPQLSSSSSHPAAPAAPQNEPPNVAFQILNQSGKESIRHFVGENITLDASASSDPDGSIANYTWRVLQYGFFDDDPSKHYGNQAVIRLESPGDRTVILELRDDQGAIMSDYQAIGVNQHRIESGKLALGQLPFGAGPLGSRNYSLPIVDGVLALSITASFPKDPANKIKLEIRSPNGTVLNRSEAIEGPLWAIAAPQPGVVGNYTAHISLVTGVATDFRLEYVAWYGYV